MSERDRPAGQQLPPAVRVLLADDEKPLRDALTDLLAGEPEIEVVAWAADADGAVSEAHRTQPTVALVDVRMPGGGHRAARDIGLVSPRTQIIGLSAYEDFASVLEMLSAGAVGYLVKGVSADEIVDAVRRAARGQASLPVEVVRGVIDELARDVAERRDAEQVLRRSEERARGLFDSAPDAIVITDGAGVIVQVNAQTEALFGYRRSELAGKAVELLLPRRFRERHVAHREVYVAAPRTRPMGADLDLAGRRKDGTEFPVEISLSTLVTDDGLLARAHIRDVSHRQRVEQALRASEKRLAAVLDSAPDAVVIVDEDGRLLLVNEQTEALFGYDRGELVGQRVELLLPERFRERHVLHRGGYVRDPRTRPMGLGLELAGRRKDGTEFPIDISLSSVETDDGRLATAFIRDVTERHAADAMRQQSQQRFRSLLESAPDGVVICSGSGRIVLVNRQTEQLFGYPRTELLGRPVETLLPERFRQRHAEHRAAYLENPRARPMGAGLELTGRRKDGSELAVDISLSTIENDGGTLLAAFVRDVSERDARIELERDLAGRRALVAHLVAVGEEERRRIAEDIHDDSIQAITAAGMRLQILRRRLTDPLHLELLAELEKTIQLSISRLRHLLFELRPPALDNEGLSAAIEIYLREAERETGIEHRLSDRLVRQPDEKVRVILYRIALEAVTNARKHARARLVSVTLQERDGGFSMRISDDGEGMDTTRMAAPEPGHVGLASMRERAELAEGWLRIDSRPGRGTAVEAWLPARAAAAGQARPAGPERSAADLPAPA